MNEADTQLRTRTVAHLNHCLGLPLDASKCFEVQVDKLLEELTTLGYCHNGDRQAHQQVYWLLQKHPVLKAAKTSAVTRSAEERRLERLKRKK